MQDSPDNKAGQQRKLLMKPPTTPEEFFKLASFISILTEEIETLASTTGGLPVSAHQVSREIEMRGLVVEAVKAYLQSQWATEDRRVLWSEVLANNQDRINKLRLLAEQRWLSLQLFSAFSEESQ